MRRALEKEKRTLLAMIDADNGATASGVREKMLMSTMPSSLRELAHEIAEFPPLPPNHLPANERARMWVEATFQWMSIAAQVDKEEMLETLEKEKRTLLAMIDIESAGAASVFIGEILAATMRPHSLRVLAHETHWGLLIRHRDGYRSGLSGFYSTAKYPAYALAENLQVAHIVANCTKNKDTFWNLLDRYRLRPIGISADIVDKPCNGFLVDAGQHVDFDRGKWFIEVDDTSTTTKYRWRPLDRVLLLRHYYVTRKSSVMDDHSPHMSKEEVMHFIDTCRLVYLQEGAEMYINGDVANPEVKLNADLLKLREILSKVLYASGRGDENCGEDDDDDELEPVPPVAAGTRAFDDELALKLGMEANSRLKESDTPSTGTKQRSQNEIGATQAHGVTRIGQAHPEEPHRGRIRAATETPRASTVSVTTSGDLGIDLETVNLRRAKSVPEVMADQGGDSAEKNVELWKIKKLIKNLETARGNGTSMISLIIRPKDQISQVSKMLADEYGTASNIKSRVNRLSVLSAITSTQQRLKLYTKVPENGLVVYCGTIITAEGKERQVTIDFEPFKPVNTSLYLCDNKFHTEALQELLESDARFGFIVMDGNGSLFGTLTGNTRDVIHKFTVDLPKKHGRGGQSALRFARLREEKRHNYVRKVAELATQFFITNDMPNVTGLILAGSADFKTELSNTDMFDQRLKVKIINVVDVSYGGENGFNQAIELSQEVLQNVKFIQEKKLISKYFDEISQDTGKYCFGVEDTLKALDLGAVETLMVWESLDITRFQLKNPTTGEEFVKHLNKEQEKNREFFTDPATGTDLETVESMPLLEWFAEKYKDFGATLEFVTNRSQEGSQFVKGFGGIGGLLRYKVDFASMTVDSDEEYLSD
ncbi:Electron transfer flavoprotein alpha-subunit [Irineochytrium annulatum]|nr:Electron transfer flavoprotein alpha-subunit [Irineochytrium annulatum]